MFRSVACVVLFDSVLVIIVILVCLPFVIDKLNAESRNIASARKKDVSEESTQDLSEYFHRWMKIQTPRFKSHGVIPSFSGQKEFLHSCNWAQVNWGFAEVFSCLFHEV